MTDPNCPYCAKGEKVAAFAYPVCEMKTSFCTYLKNKANQADVSLRTKNMSAN